MKAIVIVDDYPDSNAIRYSNLRDAKAEARRRGVSMVYRTEDLNGPGWVYWVV